MIELMVGRGLVHAVHNSFANDKVVVQVERLAAEGRAVNVVSSQLPEVIRASDRVLVMQEGRISATLYAGDISEASIARAAIANLQTGQVA